MIKALSLLGLVLVSFSQRSGTDVLVIPTKIAVEPTPFRKGQIISMQASFKQADFTCPSESSVIRDLSDGFQVRIYDEKDVPTEPTWQLSKETKYIAVTNATVAPNVADAGKKVERSFEPVMLPGNAPARIYVFIWRACNWREFFDPTKALKPGLKSAAIGGQFFRYSCPGGNKKIPTELCAYRPE